MNTGIGDCRRSRLEARSRAQGWGGPSLLASYEAERPPGRPAQRLEASRNLRRMLATRERLPGPGYLHGWPGATTPRARNTASGSPRSCGTNGSPTASCWATATTTRPWSGRTARRRRSTSRTATTRPPGPAPARRMLWLADGRSTLDLYGRGFVLLRLGSAPPSTANIERAAAERLVPLTVHRHRRAGRARL